MEGELENMFSAFSISSYTFALKNGSVETGLNFIKLKLVRNVPQSIFESPQTCLEKKCSRHSSPDSPNW